MPIPNEHDKSRKAFIERCVPIVLHEGTTKDPKQAAAICYSLWKKHKKNSRGELIDEIAEALVEKVNENSDGKNG